MTTTKPARTRTPLRRGQKTAITLGLAFLLLVVAATLWGTWAVFRDTTPETETATVALPPCPPPEIQAGTGVDQRLQRHRAVRTGASGGGRDGPARLRAGDDRQRSDGQERPDRGGDPTRTGRRRARRFWLRRQFQARCWWSISVPDASVDLAVGERFTELTALPDTRTGRTAGRPAAQLHAAYAGRVCSPDAVAPHPFAVAPWRRTRPALCGRLHRRGYLARAALDEPVATRCRALARASPSSRSNSVWAATAPIRPGSWAITVTPGRGGRRAGSRRSRPVPPRAACAALEVRGWHRS